MAAEGAGAELGGEVETSGIDRRCCHSIHTVLHRPKTVVSSPGPSRGMAWRLHFTRCYKARRHSSSATAGLAAFGLGHVDTVAVAPGRRNIRRPCRGAGTP